MDEITPTVDVSTSKLVPAIISSVLISALVAGGGVYAYQKSKADSAQKDLQAQIDSLKSQVDESKVVMATASPTPVATISPTATPIVTATPLAKPANFTSYTSTVGKYSFSYPKTWVVSEDSASQAKTSGYTSSIFLYKDQNQKTAKVGQGFEVSIGTQATTKTLDQEVQGRVASVTKENPDSNPVTTNLNLGTHKVVKLDTDNNGTTETIYYFVEDNSLYLVSCGILAETSTKSEVVQQIIGTLVVN